MAGFAGHFSSKASGNSVKGKGSVTVKGSTFIGKNTVLKHFLYFLFRILQGSLVRVRDYLREFLEFWKFDRYIFQMLKQV